MVLKTVFPNARYIHRGVLNQTITKKNSSSGTPPKSDCPGKEEKPGEQASSGDGNKSGLVLGVYEAGQKFELTPTAAEIDQKSGGKLCRHLNELSCELKLGKAFVVTDLLKEYSGGVAIASFGPRDAGFCKLEQLDRARENIRWGVGAGVRALQRRGCTRVSVDSPAHADAAAEAALLAAWRFQEYKSCGDRAAETQVSLHGGSGGSGGSGGDERRQREFQEGAARAHAQNWARYMADMPANNMTPVDLAQEAVDVLCPLGVTVEARERSWMEAQRMEAFLAVARGSCQAPLMLDCSLKTSPDAPNVLIVAKGVTYDR
ncbi:hypothetical protein evm_006111 [Chilo suppressalis]|nr:hypothetical protein evm_006111 [Chilo suppressalis]